MALGAPGLEMLCFIAARSGGLGHLATAQAARADANPADAAVDHRLDGLQIRLEPPRAHVVRVAVLPAGGPRLSAHFTLLRHFLILAGPTPALPMPSRHRARRL